MHLQGDMHTHTIASTHAYSTITENCQWAEKYGMKGIATAEKDKRDNHPQRYRG